ncbi:tetratricopeptide repeat protein [Gracilinema caldarium]|uniref:tetratricopeptide repeat protein n=1 Tax=Gracilinema caldarium TaxID=215591 RepID=UPI0026E9B938|nr:tetratricopeptide repeat protein [Gracilinema caldarium]
MLINSKTLLTVSTAVCLCIACVSAPKTVPASGSQEDPAGSGVISTEDPRAKSASVPEVSLLTDVSTQESTPVLSEPPQIFPEADLVPVFPRTSTKNVVAPLTTPVAPVLSGSDKISGIASATVSSAQTQDKPAATPSAGQAAAAASATAQKSTPGSSAQTEKKSQPVDPQNLKTPEPKSDVPLVKEPVSAGEIPELPSKTNPALVEEKVVLSRSVRATVGQLVEIPYQGAGWVYLGEMGGNKGLAYDSRRLDTDGQTFVFRCENPGTYVVKFFKQDFIKDYIINDYVEVVVGESPLPSTANSGMFTLPVDRGRVVANPRWPTAANSTGSVAPAGTGGAADTVSATGVTGATGTVNAQPAGTVAAVTTTTATAAPTAIAAPAATAAPAASAAAVTVNPPLESLSQPEEFISRAQSEYKSGKFTDALATLQVFTSKYPAGSDEAWWLFGQVLEAKGPQRDIKTALAYYKRLISEYPQSQRYQEAQQRIAYLERFYFDIR